MKRYLKSFAVVLLVVASIFSLASCQSTKTEAPVTATAPVAAEQPAQVTTPVAAEPVQAPAAVEQPAQVTTPVAEAPVIVPVRTFDFELEGYKASAIVKSGEMEIKYPAIVTENDIIGFARYISANYPDYTKYVGFEFVQGNRLVVTYPTAVDDNLGYWLTLASRGYDEYTSYLKAQARKAAFEKAKAVAEAENAAAAAAAAAEAASYTNYKIVFGVITLDARVKSGYAEVKIPAGITKDDINGFAAYVTKNYGSYVAGLTYEIKDNVLVLNYPAAADAYLDQWIPLIRFAIAEYVDYLNTDYYHLNYRGVEFDAVVKPGFASIEIPAGVTGADLEGFVTYVNAKYPQYTKGVSYGVVDGYLLLSFPPEANKNIGYWLDLAKAGLDEYIGNLVAKEAAKEAAAAQARKAAFEKAKAAAEAANAAAAAEAELRSYNYYNVVYNNFVLNVKMKAGYIDIAYPSVVTAEDIYGYLDYVSAGYGDYLNGLTVDLATPGHMILTYPESVVVNLNEWLPLVKASVEEYIDVLNTKYYSFFFGDNVFYAAVKSGCADILYPSTITEGDIRGFIGYVNKNYGQAVKGLTYEFQGSDHLILKYPASADAYIDSWLEAGMLTVTEYVQYLIDQSAAEAQARKLAFEKAKAEAEAANAAAAAAAAAEAEAKSYTYYKVVFNGVAIHVKVKSGYADFTIPTGITAKDIDGFAAYAVGKYPEYLKNNVTYEIKDGHLLLNYPKEADSNIVQWLSAAADVVNEYIVYLNTDYYTINFRGILINAAVRSGYADLTVPAGVTAKDIDGFASYISAKYPQYVKGVSYEVKNGHLLVSYPASADGNIGYWLTLAEAGVVEYLNELSAQAAAARAAAAAKAAAEAKAAEARAAEARAVAAKIAEEQSYRYFKLYFEGFTVDAKVKSGYAELAIPAGITADDINGFAEFINENYGQYVSGLSYEIKGNVLVLNYPSSADADLAQWLTLAGEAIGQYVDYINTDFYYLTFNGVGFVAAVKSGCADIVLPAEITANDINGFASYISAKYPQYVKGVSYEVRDGHLLLAYPKSADDNLGYWVKLAGIGANEYINDLIAKEAAAAQARKAAFEKAKAEAEAEAKAKAAAAAATAAATAEPVKNIEFGIGPFEFAGAFKQTSADVTLPDGVTADDIKGYNAYIERNFGPVFENITYSLKDGHLLLDYPAQSDQSFEAYFYFAANAAVQYLEAVQGGEDRAIVKSNTGEKEFDIYLVHTNDVHARILPQDGGMGYAKFAGLMGLARQATDKILLLDAGDSLHGTNLANFFKGQTVMDIMGIIGYDCFTPGNHEFNYKPDQTAKIIQYLTDAGVKVLSYNITDGYGNPYLQRYQVYDFNGFKIAVFGLTSPDTYTKADPRNLTGIFFDNDNMVKGFQGFIDMLHKQADYVVCLGHIGMDDTGESGITTDKLCSIFDGIDLFIDGHSHSYTAKPIRVNNTLIVQTGEYLKNIGVEKLHVKNGKLTGLYTQMISAEEVNDPANSVLFKSYGVKDIPEDETVAQYIALAQANLAEYYNRVVAEIPADLNGERAYVRSVQTDLGALICEAMTKTTGADFTIMNGGNIRKSLKAGPVTVGDINEVLPFENSVVVAEMKGADIYAALENGYKSLPGLNGGYPQSELEVVYNKFAKPGRRIMRVLINGKPIDKEKVYRVATNDYLAAGGDGYTQFGKILSMHGLMNEVFIDYLMKNYPVHEPTAEDKVIVKSNDGEKSFDLFFVHTNDVHGRIVPQDGGMGYAKFAGFVGLARQMTDKILLLDAGDALHGTNLVNFFKGQTVIDIMGLIGYDCFTLGNHEFNYKPESYPSIGKALADAGVKALSYNITDENGNPYLQRYQIYDYDGFKVAVFGYSTPDTYTKADPRNLEGIYFDNQKMLDGFQSFVNMLRRKADYVICLGHVGLEETGDYGLTSAEICKNIDGIDLFIDGHSHTVLEEPLQVNDSFIVQAGEYLKYFGVEKLHIENGKVTSFEYKLISTEDVNNPQNSNAIKYYGIREIPEDPNVAAYIAYMKANLSRYLDQVAAVIPMDLDGERAHVRTSQTNLGALVCEAMTKTTGADFTIMNGGNIRKSLKAGPITIGDINEVLPFENLVVVAEMKGSDIYAALENGYKSLPAQAGGYPQSELEVVYNKFAKPGKRILRVLLNGQAIDKNKVYLVATNDYLAAGGDDYKQFGKIVRSYGLMNEVFINYLNSKYPVK